MAQWVKVTHHMEIDSTVGFILDRIPWPLIEGFSGALEFVAMLISVLGTLYVFGRYGRIWWQEGLNAVLRRISTDIPQIIERFFARGVKVINVVYNGLQRDLEDRTKDISDQLADIERHVYRSQPKPVLPPYVPTTTSRILLMADLMEHLATIDDSELDRRRHRLNTLSREMIRAVDQPVFEEDEIIDGIARVRDQVLGVQEIDPDTQEAEEAFNDVKDAAVELQKTIAPNIAYNDAILLYEPDTDVDAEPEDEVAAEPKDASVSEQAPLADATKDHKTDRTA